MGDRFLGGPVGQRSDLTAVKSPIRPATRDSGSGRALRIVVLTLLAVDGVLSALAGALLMPSYIGTVPVPVSALISGCVNAALVWAALRWTPSARLAALPLWTWLLTVFLLTLDGAATDDRILDGLGVLRYSALLLIVLGAAPPLLVLRRRRPGY